jgi:hypothetical protein
MAAVVCGSKRIDENDGKARQFPASSFFPLARFAVAITARFRRMNMKPTICVSLLLASVTALAFVAQGKEILNDPIPRSSSVFVEAMDGFGPELQQAFLNDGVPLVIASDKEMADFQIIGGIRDAPEPTSMQPLNGHTTILEQEAGDQTLRTRFVIVTIVNVRTKSVAWGWGMTGVPDLASAAESCAKQLKEEMKRKHGKH